MRVEGRCQSRTKTGDRTRLGASPTVRQVPSMWLAELEPLGARHRAGRPPPGRPVPARRRHSATARGTGRTRPQIDSPAGDSRRLLPQSFGKKLMDQLQIERVLRDLAIGVPASDDGQKGQQQALWIGMEVLHLFMRPDRHGQGKRGALASQISPGSVPEATGKSPPECRRYGRVSSLGP